MAYQPIMHPRYGGSLETDSKARLDNYEASKVDNLLKSKSPHYREENSNQDYVDSQDDEIKIEKTSFEEPEEFNPKKYYKKSEKEEPIMIKSESINKEALNMEQQQSKKIIKKEVNDKKLIKDAIKEASNILVSS